MNSKLKIIFSLAIVGFIFATSVTIRQFIAPATQPGIFSCVGLSIFGLTPCPYGVAIFFLIALSSGLLLFNKIINLFSLRLFSFVGVIFSGWVVWREICLPALQLGPVFWETFSISRVPACAWGFIIYVVIFILQFSLHQASSSATKSTN